ncbi:hypothetical protein SELMODRAFT_419084 [Selaginella moellendorffii]|uniref:AP2/ERF domain-containing protein n=1 Tax=Selaginella moellendorffii TaxID=88036 RepID=D8S7S7_SELML|nr:hypothetical protein SELMODRAFT_419084 [Selaginella moellendorffii]
MAAVELASAACSDSSSSWAAQSETEEDGSEEPANSSLSTDVESGDDDHPERCGHNDVEDVYYVFEEEEVDLISNVSSLSDGETPSSKIKRCAMKKTREIVASSKQQESGKRKRNPPKSARRYTNKSSLYIGVCFTSESSGGRHTFEKSKQIYISSCNNEEAAARIYDRAYIKFHGNNCPNFPYSDYEHKIPQGIHQHAMQHESQ